MALSQKGIPAGKSSQDTAVRLAQHWPVPQQGCEAKHFSRTLGKAGSSPLGWAGSEAPGLPVGRQAGCQAWQHRQSA